MQPASARLATVASRAHARRERAIVIVELRGGGAVDATAERHDRCAVRDRQLPGE
jgi:hypothetical protein